MSKYQNPTIGTIFLGQPNTTVDNPGPVQSAKGDALNEWLQAQAQDTCDKKNQVLIQDYLNQWTGTWLPNYQSSRLKGPTGIVGDPDAVPLQPPPAYVVVVIAAEAGGIAFDIQPSGQDGQTDDNGVQTYPSTGPAIPVCDVPAYDKIVAPQKPGTGKIKS